MLKRLGLARRQRSSFDPCSVSHRRIFEAVLDHCDGATLITLLSVSRHCRILASRRVLTAHTLVLDLDHPTRPYIIYSLNPDLCRRAGAAIEAANVDDTQRRRIGLVRRNGIWVNELSSYGSTITHPIRLRVHRLVIRPHHQARCTVDLSALSLPCLTLHLSLFDTIDLELLSARKVVVQHRSEEDDDECYCINNCMRVLGYGQGWTTRVEHIIYVYLEALIRPTRTDTLNFGVIPGREPLDITVVHSLTPRVLNVRAGFFEFNRLDNYTQIELPGAHGIILRPRHPLIDTITSALGREPLVRIAGTRANYSFINLGASHGRHGEVMNLEDWMWTKEAIEILGIKVVETWLSAIKEYSSHAPMIRPDMQPDLEYGPIRIRKASRFRRAGQWVAIILLYVICAPYVVYYWGRKLRAKRDATAEIEEHEMRLTRR